MKVNKTETIENLILQNQGIVQIADVIAKGISKQYAIKYLQDHGFERATKGIYVEPDA